MTSLYGLLGVRPDASADEIRRAYYQAARRLHPDVNPDAEAAAAMRLLNEAWAVLGNPAARQRYDAQLSNAAPTQRGPAPAASPQREPEPDFAAPHPPRFLRPSALIVAVLLLIFVVTAYAGHGTTDHSRPTTPTSAAPQSSNLIGECLNAQPGYDAVVPCNQPNNGEVVLAVAASSQCPPDTRPYQLAGRSQWVCLRSSTSR